MLSYSSIEWISALTLTTLASEEPAASSTSPMLVRICRVSAATVPGAGAPVVESVAVMPDRKPNSPARIAGEIGRPGRRDLPRFDHLSGICHRRRLTRFRRGDDVEHDLEAGLDLHAHHGAGRRRIRDILSVEAVERVVLDAVVDHRVHLHQTVEGRPRRLQGRASLVKSPWVSDRISGHRFGHSAQPPNCPNKDNWQFF